jgi:hypothetical protein
MSHMNPYMQYAIEIKFVSIVRLATYLARGDG